MNLSFKNFQGALHAQDLSLKEHITAPSAINAGFVMITTVIGLAHVLDFTTERHTFSPLYMAMQMLFGI